MNFKIILSLPLLITLSSCGSFVPIQNIDKTGIDALLAASKMRIIPEMEAKNLKDLGEVIGHSCMNKSNELSASRVGAVDQAKIQAVQRGATAITNLICTEGGISLIKNCWNSWECKATALQ